MKCNRKLLTAEKVKSVTVKKLVHVTSIIPNPQCKFTYKKEK